MLCNHIFRSLYDQGAHIVVVDIGGSYKGLCELVGGYYFTYTEKDPIRFNPFYLSAGEALDTEKKESLKALLVTLWKEEHENFSRSEYVALSNALQEYYLLLQSDSTLFPCFNSFYEFLQSDYVDSLKEHKVKDRDFDIENKEDQRDDIKAHVELDPGGSDCLFAALVGGEFLRGGLVRPKDPAERHRPEYETRGDQCIDEDVGKLEVHGIGREYTKGVGGMQQN